MKTKLIIGFESLSTANFLAKVELICHSLAGNPDFPEPWPVSIPTLKQLEDMLSACRDKCGAVRYDIRYGTEARNIARQALMGHLKKIASYLEIVADGDRALLATTGYDLRRESSHGASQAPLSAPSDFRLVHGEVSGMIVAKARKRPNACAYQVQITTGSPATEASWSEGGSFRSCARIELTGLTPGKVYSVRLRAVGSGGPGAWTAASSVIPT